MLIITDANADIIYFIKKNEEEHEFTDTDFKKC